MKISSFVVMDLQIGLTQGRGPKVLYAQFLLKEMCSVHFEIHICTIDLSNINQYPNYLILKL